MPARIPPKPPTGQHRTSLRRRLLQGGALGLLRVGAQPLLERGALGLLLPGGFAAAQDDAAADIWPPVQPGRPMGFPRDHGAHADFRTEWWYLTGWLHDPAGQSFGMQITFFRSRTRHDRRNPSRFAPTQLLFAHAAIASPALGRLAHAERAARTGFGLATFSERDLEVSIGTWRLQRDADDRIHAQIGDSEFGMDLLFVPPGPPVPQGDAGLSRKGPDLAQASWYYSRPQLAVSGAVRGPRDLPTRQVSGTAWLDHEWSTEYLDPRASGWDWVGLNFDDGSALMAFRIRLRSGDVLWSDARWIPPGPQADADASTRARSRAAAATPVPTPKPEFTPLRSWQSPRTGADWPVAMRLKVGAREFQLEPLFDDQEISASQSTGTIYWEGAVRVLEGGERVGAGYLELTGYAGRVRM